MLVFRRFSIVALLLYFSACATPQRAGKGNVLDRPVPAPIPVDELPAIELDFSEDGFAYIDGRTGRPLKRSDVLRRAQNSDVILVGERHDDEKDHLLQAEIIRAVGQATPDLSVGFEMVETTHQAALDRFARREIDVDGLYAALAWDQTWGFDAELYRPLWDAVREAGARPVALNAPRKLVREVAMRGIDALSDTQKAQLPDMDLADTSHREAIKGAFEMHHHAAASEDAFERFYAAQVLWDENMAQELVRALDAGATQVVGVAGNGHVEGYRGIPQRILRRKPSVRLLTIVPIHEDDETNLVHRTREAVAERAGDVLVIQAPRAVFSL